MDLEQLGKRDSRLQSLLQQARQWQRLDKEVKDMLPANLRTHFQTACIEEGRLVLLAANNMAASRLKMIMPTLLPQLGRLNTDIAEISVRILPRTSEPEKNNNLRLSEDTLQSFRQTAGKLRASHPGLAQRLESLVEKHMKAPYD